MTDFANISLVETDMNIESGRMENNSLENGESGLAFFSSAFFTTVVHFLNFYHSSMSGATLWAH